MEIKKLNEAKKPFPVFRAIFLFLIILLGLLGSYVLGTKHPQSKETGLILGEHLPSPENSQGKSFVQSVVQDTVQKSVKQLEKGTQSIVSEAGKAATNVVNQSGNETRGFVFDNTVGKLLETVRTLPPQEQERVKKFICN